MYRRFKSVGISLALIAAFLFIMAAPATAQMRSAPAAGIPAHELIGKDVKTQNGDFLGKVDDVVLSRHGRVKDVVVNLHDTNQLVAVPMRHIRFTDQDYVVYTGNRTDLASLPAPAVYGYRAETTAPSKSGGYWKPTWQEGAQMGSGRIPASGQIPANDIIGMDVRAQNGDILGRVEDIMFTSNGMLRDFIVDVENTNRLVAVPMSDIRFTNQDYVVYTGSRTDLAALPAPEVYGYYREGTYVEPERKDMVKAGKGGYWKPSWQQGYGDLGYWPNRREGTIPPR